MADRPFRDKSRHLPSAKGDRYDTGSSGNIKFEIGECYKKRQQDKGNQDDKGKNVDWIMGYSTTQYKDEVLLDVENRCPKISAMELNLKEIPNDYLDIQLRAKSYSPWARANIIYFRNLIGNAEYIGTDLIDKITIAKEQLHRLLTDSEHGPIYGKIASEVDNLIPDIIDTLDSLNVSAVPGYRSIMLHSILEIRTDIEMSNEDIIFFCIAHYDVAGGAACFFIEKIYPELKQNPLIQENSILKNKLEEIWEKAYNLRDKHPSLGFRKSFCGSQ